MLKCPLCPLDCNTVNHACLLKMHIFMRCLNHLPTSFNVDIVHSVNLANYLLHFKLNIVNCKNIFLCQELSIKMAIFKCDLNSLGA